MKSDFATVFGIVAIVILCATLMVCGVILIVNGVSGNEYEYCAHCGEKLESGEGYSLYNINFGEDGLNALDQNLEGRGKNWYDAAG